MHFKLSYVAGDRDVGSVEGKALFNDQDPESAVDENGLYFLDQFTWTDGVCRVQIRIEADNANRAIVKLKGCSTRGIEKFNTTVAMKRE
jgi:hypothetical protein